MSNIRFERTHTRHALRKGERQTVDIRWPRLPRNPVFREGQEVEIVLNGKTMQGKIEPTLTPYLKGKRFYGVNMGASVASVEESCINAITTFLPITFVDACQPVFTQAAPCQPAPLMIRPCMAIIVYGT